MSKTAIGVVAAVVVAGGAWYWYMGGAVPEMSNDDVFGTYAYSCSNGVQFEMTLYSGLPSVALKAQGSAPFTEVTLDRVSGGAYATPDGEVALVGDGETINLTVGAVNMTCNPIPDGDNAPFNWGGAGEGTE